MTHSPHKLIPGYDTVDQVVEVTIPASTLVEALAPRPEDLDVLAEAVADAAITADGIGATPARRWDGLYEAHARLADQLGSGEPRKQGRTVTLDVAHTLDFLMQALAVVADYGLVQDTAAVRAAFGILGGVRNDEQRAEMDARVAQAAA